MNLRERLRDSITKLRAFFWKTRKIVVEQESTGIMKHLWKTVHSSAKALQQAFLLMQQKSSEITVEEKMQQISIFADSLWHSKSNYIFHRNGRFKLRGAAKWMGTFWLLSTLIHSVVTTCRMTEKWLLFDVYYHYSNLPVND